VLGGMALRDAGLADSREAGQEAIRKALSDGRAAECFGRMVAAMGGSARFVETWERVLPEAPVIRDVPAPRAGYVTAMNGEAMGLAVIGLGGGRQVETDVVDPAVGLDQVVPLGTKVEAGTPVLRIHAARQDQADRAAAALSRAIEIGDSAPDLPPLVHEFVQERLG